MVWEPPVINMTVLYLILPGLTSPDRLKIGRNES